MVNDEKGRVERVVDVLATITKKPRSESQMMMVDLSSSYPPSQIVRTAQLHQQMIGVEELGLPNAQTLKVLPVQVEQTDGVLGVRLAEGVAVEMSHQPLLDPHQRLSMSTDPVR